MWLVAFRWLGCGVGGGGGCGCSPSTELCFDGGPGYFDTGSFPLWLIVNITFIMCLFSFIKIIRQQFFGKNFICTIKTSVIKRDSIEYIYI